MCGSCVKEVVFFSENLKLSDLRKSENLEMNSLYFFTGERLDIGKCHCSILVREWKIKLYIQHYIHHVSKCKSYDMQQLVTLENSML